MTKQVFSRPRHLAVTHVFEPGNLLKTSQLTTSDKSSSFTLLTLFSILFEFPVFSFKQSPKDYPLSRVLLPSKLLNHAVPELSSRGSSPFDTHPPMSGIRTYDKLRESTNQRQRVRPWKARRTTIHDTQLRAWKWHELHEINLYHRYM
jgi:hypothetical protein